MGLEIKSLTKVLGAEVTGADLRKPLDPPTVYRATLNDGTKYRRLMQRTAISIGAVLS